MRRRIDCLSRRSARLFQVCGALTLLVTASCTVSPRRPKGASKEDTAALVAPADPMGEAEFVEADAPLIDRSLCGMPAELLAEGWPRTLAPLTSAEPSGPKDRAFTLAVMPDTQYYSSCRERHFLAQSHWIASQQKERHIMATLTLGDLTENNTHEEWEFARAALKPVLTQMPVVLATGNHDYGTDGSADRRQTHFQSYFPAAPPATKSVLAETMVVGDLENAYYRFPITSPEKTELTLGVLTLEWSPRSASVAWAKGVLQAHPSDRVIVITHAYLFYDGTRYDWASKGPDQPWNPRSYGTALSDPEATPGEGAWAPEGAYDGEMLWQELVSTHPGVFLTLSGHVLGDGQGHLASRGAAGNLVHQVLTNYQMLEEGGLGFLRLVEVSGDGTSLTMKTFSPSLEQWAIAQDQNFSLPIDPPLW